MMSMGIMGRMMRMRMRIRMKKSMSIRMRGMMMGGKYVMRRRMTSNGVVSTNRSGIALSRSSLHC